MARAMNVGELKKQLSKLPDDVPVEVWIGPDGHEKSEDVTYVEGLESGEGKRTCVLWTAPVELED